MSPRFKDTSLDGVKQDTRSGVYYFRDTVNLPDGSSVFVDKSLKTKSITQAKDEANRIRAKLIRGEAKKEELTSSRHSFGEAFDLVRKIQGPKAKNTDAQARDVIEPHLRPWFTEHCAYLDTFERDYEEKWAEYCIAQADRSEQKNLDREFRGLERISPRKLGHDRRYLVMALKRAHTKGWIKKLFTKHDFPLLEASDPVGKYIEDEDVKKILQGLKRHPKTYLQVLIAVTMGMRISEILHLRKEEVDLKTREIVLDPRRIKTRRPRKVPIPIANVVYPLLKQAIADAPGPYIFPAMDMSLGPRNPQVIPNQPQDDNRYHWDRVREETEIELRFHDLRHTAMTNALDRGMPPLTATKIFGATIEVINRIYDHLKKDRKEQFRSMFDGRFE